MQQQQGIAIPFRLSPGTLGRPLGNSLPSSDILASILCNFFLQLVTTLLLSVAILKVMLNLLSLANLRAMRTRLYCFIARHLPFHQFAEGAFFLLAELVVSACFGYSAIVVDADDHVGALDSRQAMRDGDCGVVACEKSVQGLIDQGFGFSV